MLLHERAEGAGVALLRSGDEVVVCQWPVLHCTGSTPAAGRRFRPSYIALTNW